jgi:hypothetical protein
MIFHSLTFWVGFLKSSCMSQPHRSRRIAPQRVDVFWFGRRFDFPRAQGKKTTRDRVATRSWPHNLKKQTQL